jgi:hypothetical protein
MIIVLGYGRETRAWLERRDPADTREVLVLDEAAPAPDVGRPLVHVDLDDVVAVRAAIGERRVEQVVRSPGVSPYRPGPAWLVGLAPCA